MPRCLADRLGAALGALGSECSWSYRTTFEVCGAFSDRTQQRDRPARLSLVGIDRRVDVGIRLEHGKALDGVFPGPEAL